MDEMTALMINSIGSLMAMEGKPKPTMKDIEQKTEELFAVIDKDGNKRISLKEFKDFIRTDRQILGVLVNMEVTAKEDLGTNFGIGDEGIPELDLDLEEEIHPRGLKQSAKVTAAKLGHFKLDENLAPSESFVAQNPTARTLKDCGPSKYVPSSQAGSAPDANLELDYIYGYRCHDVRNNVRYSHNGEKLIWHAGAVAIVYEKGSNTQTFFRSHNDDIHCLTVHPDPSMSLVATGQIGTNPILCVWNYNTKEVVMRTKSPLTVGIKHVAFSPDG